VPLKKDIQEPPASKDGGKSKRKTAEPKPPASDEPWRYLDDGSKVRQGRKLPYEKELHRLFKEIAGGVTLVDSFSGEVIKRNSEELAYGYAVLAQENDAVKAFFARITDVSAHSAIILPTVFTVVPILWHFGLMPARFGVPATVMIGMPLLTREQEQQFKADAQAEQQQAEAAEAAQRTTHPRGEGESKSDGEQPA